MLIEKPVRHRDPWHLKRLHGLRCWIPGCRDRRTEVHHLTHAQPKGRGLKSGDQWCLPLCATHHNPNSSESVHFDGDEGRWWSARGLDPIPEAERLWNESLTLRGIPRE